MDQLPTQFIQRLSSLLPAEWLEPALQTFARPKRTGFRVNLLKAQVADVLDQLQRSSGIACRPAAWNPAAFTVSAADRSRLTASQLASRGEIYVQNLSSLLPVMALRPQPGQWVLDLAAAPGGKSTHIAALMENCGRLSVVEPVRKRFFKLRENLQRCGVTIARAYLVDGRRVGRKTPGRFDRILLDAPCSSEARFRAARKETFRYWSPHKISESARKQRALIMSAFAALKPGGELVYCTCSFAPEENEAVVHHLLRRNSKLAELLPVQLPIANWQPGLRGFGRASFAPAVERSARVLPTEQMDAMFIARIRKRAAPGLAGA